MTTYETMLQQAADVILTRLGQADTAVVLGSGLGSYAETLEQATALPYAEIPGFPASTAPGHKGILYAGLRGGKRVYMLQGRFHAYEGYSMQEITFYVRALKLAGVRTLILTNAAGCVNTAWAPGDLMLISDFINLSGQNPLTGPNLDSFGVRFPDMSEVCSRRLRAQAHAQADRMGLTIREGVYVWMNGPCFETPAEIRMARIIGGDAVGMSTVPEMIVARHCGMEVLGISCLTNMAAGILDQPITSEEVEICANRVRNDFAALIDAVLISEAV